MHDVKISVGIIYNAWRNVDEHVFIAVLRIERVFIAT